ncbi:hypothetical protein DMUE_6167, partial [Dictyocoela muelleri]
ILLKIIYSWFKDENQVQVCRDYNVSKKIVSRIYGKLREKANYFFEINEYKLGGNGMICQIDESMFRYKQKYHVGRVNSDYRWVFGIVDISGNPKRYYIELVPNRSARYLLPIIRRVIRPGSIIWSDEWAAYNSIDSNEYSHLTVNHSINFINPLNGVHTQNIESLWNKIKKRLKKQNGNSFESLKLNIKEWMWKDNVCQNDFSKVFDLLNL